MILAGLIAARFAHFVALALAFGAVAYGGWGERETADWTRRRLRRLGAWSAWAVLISAVAVLAMTAANMAGEVAGSVDVDVWAAIVQETEFGRVWAVRIILAVLLLLTLASQRFGSAQAFKQIVSLFLVGGLVATVALTGHAQDETGLGGLAHRLSDSAHLVAAAVWIGVLVPLLYLLWKPTSVAREPDPREAARRLQGFHNIGIAAVLALVISGLINSFFLVGEVGRLFTTPYGRVLLLKLALFGGMVALAADNRRRLVPGLARALQNDLSPEVWLRKLRRHIGGELALSFAVLATVAVLGSIAPASSL